jgi:endonuclease III
MSGYSNRGGKMYLIGEKHPSINKDFASFFLKEASRLAYSYLNESKEKRELTNEEISLGKLLLELINTYKAGYNPDYFDCINSLLQDKEKEIEELIEKLKNDTNRKNLEIIKFYVCRSIEEYIKGYGVVKREHEILEKIISSSDSENIIIYCEGDKEVVEKGRPDIVELTKRYNEKKIEIVPLDEGNEKYEEWKKTWGLYYSELTNLIRDPNYSFDKNKYLEKIAETQKGRENFWIEKIKSGRIDNTLQIAIVGVDHMDSSYEEIYSIGSFAKKLEELGYDIEIIHVTSY